MINFVYRRDRIIYNDNLEPSDNGYDGILVAVYKSIKSSEIKGFDIVEALSIIISIGKFKYLITVAYLSPFQQYIFSNIFDIHFLYNSDKIIIRGD